MSPTNELALSIFHSLCRSGGEHLTQHRQVDDPKRFGLRQSTASAPAGAGVLTDFTSGDLGWHRRIDVHQAQKTDVTIPTSCKDGSSEFEGRSRIDRWVVEYRHCVPTTPSACWSHDPFGRHEQRYWDGLRWTEHVTSRGVQSIDPPIAPVTPADWYPDPFGRHEQRYWGGDAWTEHVTSAGTPTVDPPVPHPADRVIDEPPRAKQSEKVERHIGQAGAHSPQTSEGTVFTEQIMVVNQKAKLIGKSVEYAIYDHSGRQISAVRELSRGIMANAMSMRPVENRTRRLEVIDLDNRVVLSLTRPANFAKSTVIVRDAQGAEVGKIVQKSLGVIGGVRFVLESSGRAVGSIKGEGWNSWDFGIQDPTGIEIARITKTWAGWAKERFTKADNYVVEIHQELEEPLRSLVVAAALTVDVALKQGQQSHKSSLGSKRRFQ